MLRESGELIGEPRPITHQVKFYEKGDRPLEIVTAGNGSSGRWNTVRGCSRAAASCKWHPPHMRPRYENWVNGLAGD